MKQIAASREIGGKFAEEPGNGACWLWTLSRNDGEAFLRTYDQQQAIDTLLLCMGQSVNVTLRGVYQAEGVTE